jgi:hypothetical protein
MAQIKKIEIICFPCHKCENLKRNLHNIMHSLRNTYNIKLNYDLISYENKRDAFKAAARHNFNMTQLPVVLINEEVVFIGHVLGENVFRMKIMEILRS